MAPLLRPVTKMKCSMPAALASSTTCWISGRSTTVSISLGIALVAGRNRVPRPATGKIALRIGFMRLRGREVGLADGSVQTGRNEGDVYHAAGGPGKRMAAAAVRPPP